MRFSFIHAADLHIDSPLASLGVKDRAVAERFAQAGRRAVAALVQETIDSNAAFLIIAGDIFDGDWRDVTTGLFFARQLGELHRANIPTFIVKGNHDADSLMSRSLTYPDSVTTFKSTSAHSIALDAQRVVLHGRSFPQRRVPDDFVASYPARRDGWLNIGVLHTALDGTRGHASYAPCTVDDLRRFGYDYWALGHIHAAEIVADNPWIVFPGNVQGRSVRETGPRGAMRVTVEDGRIVSVAPVVLDHARWAHESVDVSGCNDEASVLRAIGDTIATLYDQSEGRPLAIRITLSGITSRHDALVARRDVIQDEARAAGFAVAGDCWIEQVKIATQPMRMATALSDDLDVAALLAAAADDPDFAGVLADLVTTITDKLPRDLRDQLASDPEALRKLAADARATLIGGLRP